MRLLWEDMNGRYAPSPSGDLHFGNLRTAVLAWLFARRSGRSFLMRIEDIDEQRSSPEFAARQLADLATLGLDWDEEPLWQSERYPIYEKALARLDTYECYCSRKDIIRAASAPHVAPGAYPGTCAELSDSERAYRRSLLAQEKRHPTIRLRADTKTWQVTDFYHGTCSGIIDDFVVYRGGQTPGWAYNLAVVVDDGDSAVDQVVRGEDLLSSTPRQAYLAHLLGYPEPTYVHVPLVLNAEGKRLAKRDGAVTLGQMLENECVEEVVEKLSASMGYPGVRSLPELLEVFEPAQLPREPWVWA